MSQFRMRCSAIGKIMTEPRSKSDGPLSIGAKTAIREVAAQDLFGVDFEISDKKIEKGNLVEPESLALYNRVFGRSAVKNTERRSDEFLTGTCDVEDDDEIVDLKSAWSLATYPLLPDDVAAAQRTLYEWQGRGYMRLWNKPRFRVAYCIVDTPEDLCRWEPLPLHSVSHIPEHLRVTTWVIERDMALEAAIVEKVKHASAYYAEVIAEFDRTHPPVRSSHPPKKTADKAATASPTAPADLPEDIFAG